jgi:dihydroflavonol-4-reductase
MKTLVLGATGQLGANLVRALLANGDQVRVLIRSVRSATQARRHHLTLQGVDVERAEGDLRDGESLRRACAGIEVIYHCAAYYPEATIPAEIATREALAQTKEIVKAAQEAGINRFVFGSTLTTIGFPARPGAPADETCRFTTEYPRNPYLMAKAAMEETVLAAAKAGLPAVVTNPTAFFGPYDSRPSSGMQIVMIATGKMPMYIQGPINAIDVRDVAVGMIRAAERGRIGERYILGNWNTTQQELNAMIARLAGARAPMLAMPYPLARLGAKLQDWTFRNVLRRPSPVPGFFVEVLRHFQHYDCSKAVRELEYPRTPVDHAIRDAVAWFRANGYLPV